MKLIRVQAGEYRTADGVWTIAREDYPSVDEWDHAERDVTWYAITTANWLNGGALPDAACEAGTRRAVVAWLKDQPATPDNSSTHRRQHVQHLHP